MPLILNKMIENESQLLVWETTENQEDIEFQIQNPFSIAAALKNIHNPKRIREKLITTLLLHRALQTNNPIELEYDDFGKPFLKSFPIKLSVSHSANYVCILLSPDKIPGIDIEIIRTRIEKLAEKFISPKEFGELEQSHPIEHMHVIWGAKETMYKIYGKKGVDFKENMSIEPFQYLEKGQIIGRIQMKNFGKEMDIHYEKISNCMLTWGLLEND